MYCSTISWWLLGEFGDSTSKELWQLHSMGQWWCWAYCREYTAYPIGQAQPKWTINLWLIVPHYRKYIYYMGSFHITQWFCYSKRRFSFQSGIHLTQMSELQMTAIRQGKKTSSDIKCLWNKKKRSHPLPKKKETCIQEFSSNKTTCITKREQPKKTNLISHCLPSAGHLGAHCLWGH